MKYFILAGESSGDIHGANLIRAIQIKDKNAQFGFWGGDAMESASQIQAFKHVRQLAFMGFWEVLKNIVTILQLFKQCKQNIRDFKPDVVILIDYPGFNIRMARKTSYFSKFMYFVKRYDILC